MSEDFSRILTEVLISLGIVAAFVVVGKGLIFAIDRVIRKFTEKTATKLDDMLLAVVERPIFYLMVLWGVYVAVHRLSVEVGEGVLAFADKVLFVLVTLFVVKMAYDVINALLEWYAAGSAERGREEIGRSVVTLLKQLVKIFVAVTGLIIVLDHFEYDISSLVAALGVGSLAIGLAAKDTLSNMISGFIIMADRPFRVGDRIESDGRLGDVVEIGLRSTKVQTIENNIVIVPNARLVDNVVLNYAYPESSMTRFLKVGVEYGSDVEKVRKAILDVAGEVPEVEGEPGVFFVAHGDSALEFQLAYRIARYRDHWAVLDKLNTAVNRRFAADGIGIAFPTRTVHLIHQGETR